MNRTQAIELARKCAAEKPESYVGDPAEFIPHEWVIAAIIAAAPQHRAELLNRTLQALGDETAARLAEAVGEPEALLFITWLRSGGFPATPSGDAYKLRCRDREVERLYANRYEFLREQDLNTIGAGGVFAGLVPDNVVLNGEDLDREIDAALTRELHDDLDISAQPETSFLPPDWPL